jgi:hypothetical protein
VSTLDLSKLTDAELWNAKRDRAITDAEHDAEWERRCAAGRRQRKQHSGQARAELEAKISARESARAAEQPATSADWADLRLRIEALEAARRPAPSPVSQQSSADALSHWTLEQQVGTFSNTDVFVRLMKSPNDPVLRAEAAKRCLPLPGNVK